MVDQVVATVASAASAELIYSDTADDFEDVYENVASFPISIDLLLCLLLAACRSLRKVTVLDPFPPIFLDIRGDADYEDCRHGVNSLPAIEVVFEP
jgi:hypothetical protein